MRFHKKQLSTWVGGVPISGCIFGEVYSNVPTPTTDVSKLRLCVNAGGKKHMVGLASGVSYNSASITGSPFETKLYYHRADIQLVIVGIVGDEK